MKIVLSITGLCLATLLSACGGGGGSTTGPVASSTSQTYTAAATPGELVSYTVDPVALTYSYTITESQYGLTGAKGSGSLTALGTNGYSLSGIPGSRIQLLPNGLMLGSIKHDFGAGVKTVAVMGMSSPVSSLNGVAGTYNFVSYNCSTNSCTANYGALKVNSTGTWEYCISGDFAATTACARTGTGNLTAVSGGKFDVYDGASKVGTLLAMSSGGQNVGIIDLKDTRTGNANVFGKGMVIASSKVAVNTALTDGNWYSYGSNGYYTEFATSGTTLTYSNVSSGSTPPQSTVTKDSPWAGMIATSTSTQHALLAGFGVYVLADTATNYFEIGLKKVAAVAAATPLAVTSTSFQNNGVIPAKYASTAQTGGLNTSPALSIANLPAGTASIAIVMDDETSPCGVGSSACVHWGVFNLPASKVAIAENENLSAINGVQLGSNYTNGTGYAGPNPPSNHVYNLTVYALNSSLTGLAASYTRSQFEAAFGSKILDKTTLSGKYPL